MGCGGAKRVVHPKLSFTLDITGVPYYDRTFQDLERPLTLVDHYSHEVKKILRRFYKAVGIYKLLRDSKVMDGVIAMLMCYSASGKGSLESVGFRLIAVSPYIEVEGSALVDEHKSIPGLWNDLVRLAETLPGQLNPLLPIIRQAQVTNAGIIHTDLPNNIKQTVIEMNLGITESAKVIKAVLANHGKICQAPCILEETIAKIDMINKVLERVTEEVGKVKSEVEDIGKQAFEKKIMEPAELVAGFWTVLEEKKRIVTLSRLTKQTVLAIS